MKKAIITGVTGQDGSYLSEFLLNKGYEVHGIVRKSTCNTMPNIDHLTKEKNLHLHLGDVTDYNRLTEIIHSINPDEIYNLAAQSHVGVSFDLPDYTFRINAGGALNILNIIKKFNPRIKFYQASTSEFYGKAPEKPQNELDRFHPRSPYACAKLFAYWTTVNYREAYNLFACNGILFNHESPRRGDAFVTKKIVNGIKNIILGKQKQLVLGNIYSKRDWGYAPEYVEAMWRIVNHDTPEDFVIATGETHTIKDFVNEAFKYVGVDLIWSGYQCNEIAQDKFTGKTIVKISEEFYRPSDNELLIGDFSKAQEKLKWTPKIKFKDLVKVMMGEVN